MSAGDPTRPADRTSAPSGVIALRLVVALAALAAGVSAVVIAILLVQSVLSA